MSFKYCQCCIVLSILIEIVQANFHGRSLNWFGCIFSHVESELSSLVSSIRTRLNFHLHSVFFLIAFSDGVANMAMKRLWNKDASGYRRNMFAIESKEIDRLPLKHSPYRCVDSLKKKNAVNSDE